MFDVACRFERPNCNIDRKGGVLHFSGRSSLMNCPGCSRPASNLFRWDKCGNVRLAQNLNLPVLLYTSPDFLWSHLGPFLGGCDQFHSCRSAAMGSTSVSRRAGM